jgi:phosphoribosylaminoimidazole (AIR) synthetase
MAILFHAPNLAIFHKLQVHRAVKIGGSGWFKNVKRAVMRGIFSKFVSEKMRK